MAEGMSNAEIMAERMSAADQKNLQSLVHRIATHIVEGSAAVQELRATVARLDDPRSDLECVVAQNWLSASKIIQEAGKNITSWENFINALRITYGDDKETLKLDKGSKEEPENLLESSSKELWGQGATEHVKSRELNINEFDISSTSLHPETESHTELLGARNSFINESSQDDIDEAHPKMQPNKPKRPPGKTRANPNEMAGLKRGKKPRVQFSTGRELDDAQVLALKKSGRCFFCEEWGHRASACPANPENL